MWQRTVCGASVVLALSTFVDAQQTTFRTNTMLVVEPVTVTDASGRPIEGLTAQDFVVTEDGVRQAVAFAEFQRLRDGSVGPESPTDITLSPDEPPSVVSAGIATSPSGAIRYGDRRLLAFYFDMTGMPQADQVRALWSADSYISSKMTAADLVAIMTFGGDAVRVRLDFTDDRERLHQAIRRLLEGNDRNGDGIPDEPDDPGTAFGQNGGEFNFLKADRQLSALQTAVSMLRPLVEQKTLIWFVSGLTRRGTDNQAQLTATVNAAIRSNVTINPIDARGLLAEPPFGSASTPSPTGLSAFTGAAGQSIANRAQQSQDILYAMAKDTRGVALFDDNDLSVGVARAAEEVRSYYLIGYYTARTETDGRFRRIKVSLVGHPTAVLAYRDGYFAEKVFVKFTATDKERELEDALMSGDPVTDMPIALEVNYFQINRSEYFVPVSVRIPGGEFIDRERPSSRVQIDVIGEVKDDRGVTVQNVRDKLDIPMTSDRVAQVAARPLQYETGFTLLPGDYAIKLLVRDDASGKMGTYQATFAIPNLSREMVQVRTSSIALGSQRVPIADALFSVQQKIPSSVANPLVSHGERLVPSVTHVFSADRDLYVAFDVYRQPTEPSGPLVAFVSLFREGEQAFETDPLSVPASSVVTPFEFTVPMIRIRPGDYECQVTVLDLGQHKARFWREPIEVVP